MPQALNWIINWKYIFQTCELPLKLTPYTHHQYAYFPYCSLYISWGADKESLFVDVDMWFRGDDVRRSLVLVTLRGQRVGRIGVKSRTHLVNFDSTIVISNFKLRTGKQIEIRSIIKWSRSVTYNFNVNLQMIKKYW